MVCCTHSQWLGISTGEKTSDLLESDRAQTLLANSPYIEEQCPSLFVLIGSISKARAIQELVSVKSPTPAYVHGEVHLHLDPSSAFSKRPIYVADGNIPERHRRGKIPPAASCHETIRHSFRQTGKEPLDASSAAGQVYAQLLHPFADVFCLFAADLGGLRGVSRQVAAWLEKPQASLLPTETYPSLIIVTEGSTRTGEKAIKDWFLENLAADTSRSLFDRFSGLDVVALSQVGTMSNGARHRRLKDRLMRVRDRISKHRTDSRTLFSSDWLANTSRGAARSLLTLWLRQGYTTPSLQTSGSISPTFFSL
jgi:hypothetical protein